MKSLKAKLAQTILKKTNKVKTAQVCRQQTYRQTRFESPKINSNTYGHLVFKNDTEIIQWGRNNLFNKWSWINWISTCKELDWFPVSPYVHKLSQMDWD